MAQIKEIVEILREAGIKETPNRILVLEALVNASGPMTMTQIATQLETVDKSNVFRALTLFREHHLVHAFEACDEGTQYEFCKSHDHDGPDNDRHIHFHCTSCHRTYCFDTLPIPEVQTPAGFVTADASFVLSGLCPDCSRKSFR